MGRIGAAGFRQRYSRVEAGREGWRWMMRVPSRGADANTSIKSRIRYQIEREDLTS